MPRPTVSSTNTLVRIRAWFGLRQDQLALFLAVSPGLVQAVERGQRGLSLAVATALLPLLQQLPEPAALAAAEAPTALPPGMPAPDAGALDFRRRVCLQRAAKLRAQAAQIAQRGHYAHRWQQALAALLPLADAPDLDPERATWLRRWLQRHARPLPPEAVTRWHLLRAQAHAYETEAAALAATSS